MASTHDDRIYGQCNCGAIKISILTSQFPTKCTMCHCLNCRASSGSLFAVNLATPTKAIQVTGNTKIWTDKANSGRLSDRHFCGNCGSAVMTIVRELPDNTFLKGGLFKTFGVNLPKPWKQLFTRRRETWETRMEGVEEVD